jgi:hypothetical protein
MSDQHVGAYRGRMRSIENRLSFHNAKQISNWREGAHLARKIAKGIFSFR